MRHADATHAFDGDAAGERLIFPAPERNKEPIAAVLREVLPATGRVLEIGAGSGQHTAYFAREFPNLIWLPSEPEAHLRQSILAWVAEAGVTNAEPPFELDARSDDWPVGPVDAITCINVIHISPWETCTGLFEGAGRMVKEGGLVFLYGPFAIDGIHTSQGNIDFDASLRAGNPAHGIRDVRDVTALAGENGFKLEAQIDMPSNNFSLIFRK